MSRGKLLRSITCLTCHAVLAIALEMGQWKVGGASNGWSGKQTQNGPSPQRCAQPSNHLLPYATSKARPTKTPNPVLGGGASDASVSESAATSPTAPVQKDSSPLKEGIPFRNLLQRDESGKKPERTPLRSETDVAAQMISPVASPERNATRC